MNLQKPLKADLPIIDALRLAATLWILLFHLLPDLTLFFGPLPIIPYGYLGVDILFAISGFLVGYHYFDRLQSRDPREYRDFLISRLARIYPLHLVMLLIVALLVGIAPFAGITVNHQTDYTWTSFFAQLFLVSAWHIPAVMTWNDYAWAISALWLMYLLSPVMIRSIAQLKGSFSFIIAIFFLGCLTPCIRMIQPFDSFVAYAIPRAISGFGIGLLIYRWMETCHMIPQERSQNQRTPIWLHQAAKICYAVYMVQYVVLMAFKKLIPEEWYIYSGTVMQIAYLTAIIIVVIVFAWIAHLAIEEPARRRFKPKAR